MMIFRSRFAALRKTGPKRRPPTIWIKKGSKTTLGYEDDIKWLCPPERGRLHQQGPHHTCETPYLRTGPGAPGLIPWLRDKRAGGRRLDKAYTSKANRDALRAVEKRGGRRISKRRLRDRAMPMPRCSTARYFGLARTKRPTGDDGDRAEPAWHRPSTGKHRQSHNQITKTALPDVRSCKASGSDRMAKSRLPPNITLSRSGL